MIQRDQRPTIVWLDQSAWIGLAKEKAAARRQRQVSLSDRMAALVNSGDLQVVLSASNYLELWHRPDWRSRRPVAEMMRSLSGFKSIAPPHSLCRLEIVNIIRRMEGGTERKIPAIGSGVNHAFDHPMGRLRLVPQIPTLGFDPPELATPPAWRILQTPPHRDAYEWFSLAAPGIDFPQTTPRIDRTPEHREGSQFAIRQQGLRQRLEAIGAVDRLDDGLLLEHFVGAILDNLNDACEQANIAPLQLLSRLAPTEPRLAIDQLVRQLPSQLAMLHCMRLKHQNPSSSWGQHDRADLLGMTGPMAYCDAVFLDAEWHHYASRSRPAHALYAKAHRWRDLDQFIAGHEG